MQTDRESTQVSNERHQITANKPRATLSAIKRLKQRVERRESGAEKHQQGVIGRTVILVADSVAGMLCPIVSYCRSGIVRNSRAVWEFLGVPGSTWLRVRGVQRNQDVCAAVRGHGL